MSIRIYYHRDDLDGQCAGAICKYKFPDAIMCPISYGDNFEWDEIKPEDEVYMVDFALQPFLEMERLNHSCYLYWIDHHKSAIDQAQAYNFFGTLDTSKAACELTWEYLFPDRPVPLAVKLLSLYDSWSYQGHELEDMVLPFQMRMRMEELDPRDWDGLIEKGGTGPKWHNLFMQDDLSYWVSEGRLLLRYDEANKAKYAQTYTFRTRLLHSIGNNRGREILADMGYNCIAVNLGHTNSKVFDSVWKRECAECGGDGMIYDCLDHTGCVSNHKLLCPNCHNSGFIEPYDLMITFVRRKDKLWNVSLYSTKEEVDCGAIAKSFGGGGHKGAAGFQCKELPFEY